jgi:hypothetical protein
MIVSWTAVLARARSMEQDSIGHLRSSSVLVHGVEGDFICSFSCIESNEVA